MEQATQKLARGSRNNGLWIIAIFKLAKGLLLLAVGMGALTLLHKDAADVVAQWVDVLRVDPDNRYLHGLLAKLTILDQRKLEEISAGAFFYSGLMLTEGIGLLLRKHWAEYLTAIATASFIPLEIYELAKRLSMAKLAVIGLNALVVWYLVARLRRERSERIILAQTTTPRRG